jgi:hypothetical protein
MPPLLSEPSSAGLYSLPIFERVGKAADGRQVELKLPIQST